MLVDRTPNTRVILLFHGKTSASRASWTKPRRRRVRPPAKGRSRVQAGRSTSASRLSPARHHRRDGTGTNDYGGSVLPRTTRLLAGWNAGDAVELHALIAAGQDSPPRHRVAALTTTVGAATVTWTGFGACTASTVVRHPTRADGSANSRAPKKSHLGPRGERTHARAGRKKKRLYRRLLNELLSSASEQLAGNLRARVVVSSAQFPAQHRDRTHTAESGGAAPKARSPFLRARSRWASLALHGRKGPGHAAFSTPDRRARGRDSAAWREWERRPSIRPGAGDAGGAHRRARKK